ncbi:NAD(P)-dependent oxidoreductase [Burkholderia cepacia]|uniref:NAD(P)-dependent oxidoreductase n=1 Tax=Burkholderia cepacia TaxID=292 RepID=UPI002FE394B7
MKQTISRDIMVFGQLAPEAIMELERTARVFAFTEPSAVRLGKEHENVGVLVFRSPFKIDADILDALPSLRQVIRAGSGVEGVDMEALRIRGISLKMIQADGSAVAELAVAALLNLLRHIVYGTQSLAAGKWCKSQLVGRQLSGSTVVIVGFGRIGRSLAKILSGFSCKILVHDRSPDVMEKRVAAATYGAEFSDIDDAVQGGDYIFVCCPLTVETSHLFDTRRLAMMRSDAILVNVARAKIVDTDALIDALDMGGLAGACIDVFDLEPPTNSRLLVHPKVLATPHIGAQTREAQVDIGMRLVQAARQSFHD